MAHIGNITYTVGKVIALFGNLFKNYFKSSVIILLLVKIRSWLVSS